jgi:hypothetical protein
MKNKLLLAALILAFNACDSLTKNNSALENATEFGESFNDSAVVAISMDSLLNHLPLTKPMQGIFTGKVIQVCQSRGCWIKLDAGNGSSIFVGTDEAFTMPKSIVGKTVNVNGYAYMDTTDVETLRHYAKDEGKSREEIEKITEPLIEVSIKATGVKIK